MWLQIDGRKSFVATGGKPFVPGRPTAVLIHGAGLDHTCWQLQSRWLAWHGWSVLAVDLPAHGRSAGPPLVSIAAMSDWIEHLLDVAKAGDAALIGHSMGAVVALETAARLPQRISHLALLGLSSSMPVHPTLLAAARDTPTKAYDMMTGWCFPNAAKLGGNPAPGVWMTGAARALLGGGREGALAADLGACAEWTSGLASAARITCPALLVLGRLDIMTPARKGEELAQRISGARTVVLPDCGHMMMQEAPDATLDALIMHLGAK